MLYENENLKQISFPIGGIGSGCIGLAGNGQLIDWEIANRPNKRSESEYSFLAVRCMKNGTVEDARVLIGDKDENCIGRGAGLSAACMNGFPHFEKNTFDGEYPIAELKFYDEHFPGCVRMKAFNPYIPHNSLDSSIPAAFFEIEFENSSECEVVYETVFSLRGMFDSTLNKRLDSDNGITIYDANNIDNNMTLIAEGEQVELCDYWYRGWFNSFFKENIRAFWSEFSSGAPLKLRGYEQNGCHDICSVGASVCVAPGMRKRVRFVLSWSFPKRFNYWAPLKDENGNDVAWKNFYATVWQDSSKSAIYAMSNWDELYFKTSSFKNALYCSTLSDAVKSAVGSALSVLKSPTVIRLEDGSLYGFEGTIGNAGSCEGTCQHVWNYAYVCCYLFPDLERGLRDNEYKYSLLDSGEMVFRIALPFWREEKANLFPLGEKARPCVDGQMGEIIKTFREWKFSGDTQWLNGIWHNVKKTIDFAWSAENSQRWDLDCVGILVGRQHHTLDIELFGPNGWLQGFYLAALKAASEMADAVGDTEAAMRYRKLFESGYEYTKNQLFNGKYFIQKVNIKDKEICDSFDCSHLFWNDEVRELSYQLVDGCLIDQLVAQWHAELCGIGEVFDTKQTKIAALSIYENNYKKMLRYTINPWRLFAINDDGGTIICSYPDGTSRPANPIPYAEEVMSGFEYAFAGVLMINGYIEQAEQVIATARRRYDGKRGNPWDDIECGHNYARSMSAFSLVPLICGFKADMCKCELTFNPRVTERPFKSFWSTASAWGIIEIFDNSTKIIVSDGEIPIRTLNLSYLRTVSSVQLNEQRLRFSFDSGRINLENVILKSRSIIEILEENNG